ncbi:MAG: cadherin-like beta sandwich domain-containing protein, partial [Clostridia bacterium]|nr:cadherin-like beta sandwich domain-containing protein [Clostridia bacterium]
MKKRISILLVVTMLVSMFCTFSIASAEGETAKPEVLIYGGTQFDRLVYDDENGDGTGEDNILSKYFKWIPEDFGEEEISADGYFSVNVALRNFKPLSAFSIALNYDNTIMDVVTQEVYDTGKTDKYEQPVMGKRPKVATDKDPVFYCGLTTGAISTSALSYDPVLTPGYPSVGRVFGEVSCLSGYGPSSTKPNHFINIGTFTFKFKDGKSEADLTANSISFPTLAEVNAYVTGMYDSLQYFQKEDNARLEASKGDIYYTIDINGIVGSTNKPSAPVEPEQSTEPVEPEQSTEPVEPEQSTEPVEPEQSTEPVEPEQSTEPEAPALSDNVALDSFGVSGIDEPTEVDGIYEVKVDTSAYVYIWARPADTKATVKSAIVDSEADVATAEYNGGKTAELKLATGETKYVAFEITAEDRETKEVYTVKLYREASSNVVLDSFGVSGIAVPTEV